MIFTDSIHYNYIFHVLLANGSSPCLLYRRLQWVTDVASSAAAGHSVDPLVRDQATVQAIRRFVAVIPSRRLDRSNHRITCLVCRCLFCCRHQTL